MEYFMKHNVNGRIDFAQLLDVLHAHSKVEKVVDEILGAFEAQDKDKKGVLSAAEISQVLTSTGERMNQREVTQLFRDAGMMNYKQLLQALLGPHPDYN